MKRLVKNFFTLALFLGLVFGNAAVAKAANITAINVNGDNNKISVSGSCDASVLACAILVYDSTGATLVDMESCAANGGSYSYTLSNTFAAGDYVVKVADYNGGSYASKTVSVNGSATVAAAAPSTAKAPKTAENPIFWVAFAFVGLAAGLTAARVRKAYK